MTETASTSWDATGRLVLPGFSTPDECARLRRACDHALAQLTADPRQADSANIAFLTQRKYFEEDLEPLIDMLEWIAAPRIRALLEPLGPAPLRFFNTQYFHEQATRNWDGPWHRDTQFEAWNDPDLERRRMEGADAVHLRVAFEHDDRLQVVPGSHVRWDSAEELAIRRGENPTQHDMPGRERIALQPGDACVFHAWMVHRGTYRTTPPRRTFDVIYGYGPPPDFGQPAPPAVFRDPEIRDRLSAEALAFYEPLLV